MPKQSYNELQQENEALKKQNKNLRDELKWADDNRTHMAKILAEVRTTVDSRIDRNPTTSDLLGVTDFVGASGAANLLAAGYDVLLKVVRGRLRHRKLQLTKGQRTWLLAVEAGKKT